MSPNPATASVEHLVEVVATRVVNQVLEAIDVDAVLRRVDVEGVIERVDVERLIEHVDVDGIVKRIDVDDIIKRIDVNAIVGEIDVDSLVGNTEIGSLIAKSTTGIFTEVLDVIRAQGVGLDDFCAKWTNRVLRRDATSLPTGPGNALPAVEAVMPRLDSAEYEPVGPLPTATAPPSSVEEQQHLDLITDAPPPPELTVERQGQYAGAASRLAAIVMDGVMSWAIFVAAVSLVSFGVELITTRTVDVAKHPVITVTSLVLWEFAYYAYQWAIGGRTIGMATFGIRVVTVEGGPISGRDACVRTLVLPLSIVALLLGCLGILTNRERRGWHDRAAGTVVVYAWDARAARLRWLADSASTRPA